MSSSITPPGPVVTSTVQQPATIPTTQDCTPAASATTATVGEGMKLQQDGIDKAIQNVPPRTDPAAPDDSSVSDISMEQPTALLGPADLTALQLKSAAQRQTADTTSTGLPAPDTSSQAVKDIAVNKSQILGSSTTDIMSPMTDDVSQTGSAMDSISQILDQVFQFNFGSFLAQQCWIDLQVQTSPTFTFNDDQPKTETRNTDEPVVVRRWMEMMMIGGKLTQVITEQFRTTLQTLTKIDVKQSVVHTFTRQEMSKTLDAMQKKGLLPAAIPNRDVICDNLARAAQHTFERLNSRAPREDSQPGF